MDVISLISSSPAPVTADPGTMVVGMILAVGLSAAAQMLMPKNAPVMDNRPPILTDRGSPIPMLIGTRRIPGFLCWAGDRSFAKAGGGKSFMGGGAGGGGNYSEAGWHVLCIGPASRLTGIYEAGTAIWTGDLNPGNSPSGTHIHTTKGEAYIYWGEFDQPACPTLASRLGTTSTWPCVCYIFWNKKLLGGSAMWPDVEYELTAGIMDAVLQQSPPWISESAVATTGLTASFVAPTLDVGLSLGGSAGIINEVVKVGSHKKSLGQDYALDRGAGLIYFHSSGTIRSSDTVSVTFDTDGSGDDGPNPAHVLWQILTAPAPWGCAIDPAYMDFIAFEELGQIFATERQACHVLANSAVSGVDLVNSILMDIGVALPQVGDILSPAAIRHQDAADLPMLTDDMLVVPAPPPRQQVHEQMLPDRLVFVIKDRANAYRDMDIVIDDDSQAGLRQRTKQQRIDIPTVIARLSAYAVVKRRSQELLTNVEKYSLEVSRQARTLRPGQAFILTGYGQLRATSVETLVGNRTAKIEAVLDQYSGEPGTYAPGNINDVFNVPVSQTADPDLLVIVQEAPEALSATPALAVLRVAANAQISGAHVWLSADGISYSDAGTQDTAAAGGVLQTDLPAGTLDVMEQGPVITAFDQGMDGVLDLSGNLTAWQTGAQIAIIDSEIFFLRNVTAVSGGWRLDGLIRARYDTDAQLHTAGTGVAIMGAGGVKLFSSGLLRANSTVYVKTQPIVGNTGADLSLVTPVAVSIGSPRSLRPLPPDNFLANRGPSINQYTSGGNVTFTWTYRVKDGQGRAAGEQNAGDAIGAGEPVHEGEFRILICALDNTVKRTVLVNDDTGTTTYGNASMLTDFGSEPASFVAKLSNVSGSYESTTRSITINKV